MSTEEFQDGQHGIQLGYRQRMILAILNFCVTVLLPTKFWLNLTFCLGGCLLKNFKMVAMVAILAI